MGESVVVQETYQQRIEKWREARESALRAPDGWLSLAGLFVLEDGEHTVGSGEENLIVLPDSAPKHLGRLHYQQGEAHLFLSEEIPLILDGTPINENETVVTMVDNADGRKPTMVKIGAITLNLHRYGEEVALRVRDSTSPVIAEFNGCEWYEIKAEYRVQGRLLRQETPTSVPVPTSVKSVDHFQSVGSVSFELLGQPLQLLASAPNRQDELFIIFRDTTAGRTTYGAGRYLYADVDDAGNVTLDFNKAYSPPCAFTPYATCSLPPTQNILQVAIEAGEQY